MRWDVGGVVRILGGWFWVVGFLCDGAHWLFGTFDLIYAIVGISLLMFFLLEFFGGKIW